MKIILICTGGGHWLGDRVWSSDQCTPGFLLYLYLHLHLLWSPDECTPIFRFHAEIDKLKKGANDTFSRHAFMTKYLSFVPKFYVCCHLSPSKYFLPHHDNMHCNAQNFYFTRIFHIAFSRVLEFKSEFSVVCWFFFDLDIKCNLNVKH